MWNIMYIVYYIHIYIIYMWNIMYIVYLYYIVHYIYFNRATQEKRHRGPRKLQRD